MKNGSSLADTIRTGFIEGNQVAMLKPPIPGDDAERVQRLRGLSLLDTPADESFDRITRLAKRLLGTEIALVSLVDHDRQWFKSAQGLAAPETSREVSFCGHAILGDETFVVPDATLDPRFSDNPLVTGDPSIRLYAGHPIRSPDGYAIGTLCVIDSETREFDAHDAETLRDLAALVDKEIKYQDLNQSERELRSQLARTERRASVDSLTRVWNRAAVTELLATELERIRRESGSLSIALIDVDHFKQINDQHGHQTGDEVLRVSTRRLRENLRPNDSLGRYGGDEFLLVAPGCGPDETGGLVERMRRSLSHHPLRIATDLSMRVTASIGVSGVVAPPEHLDPEQLVKAADIALYEAKRRGRDCVEVFSSPVIDVVPLSGQRPCESGTRQMAEAALPPRRSAGGATSA